MDIGIKDPMDAVTDLTTNIVFISLEVYKNILHDFIKYESGAILGIRQKETIVSAYCYDKIGSKLSKFNEYIPNVIFLEHIISNWFECDINFFGILHSHPVKYQKLSHSDILYATNFCKINEVNFVYMFLFISETKQILGYKVFFDGFIIKVPITIS